MSREIVEKIKCPKCGMENDYTIWQTLNAQMSPEAKEKLISGSLFDYHCSHCGSHSNFGYPILYHDMSHQAMVYYVNEAAVEQTIQTMTDAQEKMGVDMPGYRRRIVTNPNALREKAIIFDHDLDDRVVEIIKLIYLADASEQFPDANISAAYLIVKDEKYIIEFIADEPLCGEIPISVYEKIKNDFSNRLYGYEDQEYIVDINWASDFLKE